MIQHQELAQAARLLSLAEAQHWIARAVTERTEYDRTVAVVRRTVAVVRARLDEATFAMAWAEGQVMTLEQAVTAALNH
jgi:hypothetical protein